MTMNPIVDETSDSGGRRAEISGSIWSGVYSLSLHQLDILADRRWVLQRNNPYRRSNVQDGFVTFGFAEVVDWLGRVTTAALKAANLKLQAMFEERQRLESELLEIAEKERRRIGFDLHDDLGQKLTGAGFMAEKTRQ